MRVSLLSAIIVLAALPAGLQAEPSRKAIEARYTKAYDTCLNTGDAAKGVTPAMRFCVSQELERQDKRLNQAYAKVMKRLNVAQKTKLKTAQRAWIKSREKQCRAEADAYEGGTIAPQIYSSCLLDEAIIRTIWLENYK